MLTKPQLLGLCNRSDQALTDGVFLPLQSFWQKLMHVLSGPSKTPTEKHYDDAKRAGGDAYDHAGNVRKPFIPLNHMCLASSHVRVVTAACIAYDHAGNVRCAQSSLRDHIIIT